MSETGCPIGIIDSGVGGLSFYRRVRTTLPCESLLYVADSQYLPYGSLTTEQICERVLRLSEFLILRNVKAIVLACNTATAAGIDALRLSTSIPVVGFEPPIKPAMSVSDKKLVSVWVTPATAVSSRFKMLVERHLKEGRIIVQACPGLAEAIEKRLPELPQLLERFLENSKAEGVDALALGCTHYELIADQIAELAGQSMRIVEPSTGALKRLKSFILNQDAPNSRGRQGEVTFFTTGLAADFSALAANWLPGMTPTIVSKIQIPEVICSVM